MFCCDPGAGLFRENRGQATPRFFIPGPKPVWCSVFRLAVKTKKKKGPPFGEKGIFSPASTQIWAFGFQKAQKKTMGWGRGALGARPEGGVPGTKGAGGGLVRSFAHHRVGFRGAAAKTMRVSGGPDHDFSQGDQKAAFGARAILIRKRAGVRGPRGFLGEKPIRLGGPSRWTISSFVGFRRGCSG